MLKFRGAAAETGLGGLAAAETRLSAVQQVGLSAAIATLAKIKFSRVSYELEATRNGSPAIAKVRM